MIGYSQTTEVKIIRRTHRVTINVGVSAMNLRGYLSSVPDGARLASVDCLDDSLEVRLGFIEEMVADDCVKDKP